MRSSFAFRLGISVVTGLVAQVHAATESHWTNGWYSPPQAEMPLFANATVRMVVRLTVGGDRLRLRFSNLYGHTALKIGAVHVSAAAHGQDVTFKGQPQITLAPGMSAVNDPAGLETHPGAELVISVFLSGGDTEGNHAAGGNCRK